MADKNDPDRFSFFNYFLSPWASGRGWARTLDLRMMRRVFYHCATSAVCPWINDVKGKSSFLLIKLVLKIKWLSNSA
jgi:hypothetical protein